MKLLPLKIVSNFLRSLSGIEKANLAVLLKDVLNYPEIPDDELISNAIDDWYDGESSVEDTYSDLKNNVESFNE